MAFESHLHWSFKEEHVLLSNIVLKSPASFLAAVVLVLVVCLVERFATFLLDTHWEPHMFKLSRLSLALWKTGLYSSATFLRLCYMLVAMTFNLWLIGTIIVALSSAQFVIELRRLPKARESFPRREREVTSQQPLLSDDDCERTYPPKSVKTHPRSKSKPDDIFIHPAQSNIARADAVALELGLGGETDRVRANTYTRSEPPWEIGKGKDMARGMLLGSHHKQRSRDSQSSVNEGSESEDNYS